MQLHGAGVRRRKGRGMSISGAGVQLRGAGVRRKRGGMAISGAGYRKRRKTRRGRRGGGWASRALLYGPVVSSVASLAGAAMGRRKGVVARLSQRFRGKLQGGGGRFLSGATWHGYGKGSGMSISGAGLYGKRLLGRGGQGRRQI